MEFAFIIMLVVWFLASIPESRERARNARLREEREEREYQRELELAQFLRENGDPLNLLPTLEK